MRIKALLVVLVAAAAGAAPGGEYKNYLLVVNGKEHEINLDEPIRVEMEGGESLTILLKRKAYWKYADEFVSFHRKSDLGVSRQDLGEGIVQLMTATATGTLIMIQEYSAMNPSLLAPMMLQELTKEEVGYGYKLAKEEIRRTTKAGVTLTGLKGTLTLKDDQSTWEILAFGKKDKGILVMTQIDKEFAKADREVLDRFWETLEIHF